MSVFVGKCIPDKTESTMSPSQLTKSVSGIQGIPEFISGRSGKVFFYFFKWLETKLYYLERSFNNGITRLKTIDIISL